MPLQTDFDCDSLPLQRFAWARFGAVQLLLLPAPARPRPCAASLYLVLLQLLLLLFSRCDSVRAPLSGSALFMPQYIDIYICIYILLPFYIYVQYIYNMFAVSFVCPLLYSFFVLSALSSYCAYGVGLLLCSRNHFDFLFSTHTHARTHGHWLKTAAASLSRKNPAHSLAPSLSLSPFPCLCPSFYLLLKVNSHPLKFATKNVTRLAFRLLSSKQEEGEGQGKYIYLFINGKVPLQMEKVEFQLIYKSKRKTALELELRDRSLKFRK